METEARHVFLGSCKQNCWWWMDNIHLTVNPIFHLLSYLEVTRDASPTGWGDLHGQCKTGGHWSSDEATEHISYVELLAVFLTLHTFCKDMQVLAEPTDNGRLFQREGVQELKALAPVLVLILGTDRVIPLFDVSEHDGREVAIKERK